MVSGTSGPSRYCLVYSSWLNPPTLKLRWTHRSPSQLRSPVPDRTGCPEINSTKTVLVLNLYMAIVLVSVISGLTVFYLRDVLFTAEEFAVNFYPNGGILHEIYTFLALSIILTVCSIIKCKSLKTIIKFSTLTSLTCILLESVVYLYKELFSPKEYKPEYPMLIIIMGTIFQFIYYTSILSVIPIAAFHIKNRFIRNRI